MTSKHTELGLPWTIEFDRPLGPAIFNNRGVRIAYVVGAPLITDDKDKDHAAFIVKSVNLHHELVAALQAFVDYHEGDYEVSPEQKRALRVLAKAKEDT